MVLFFNWVVGNEFECFGGEMEWGLCGSFHFVGFWKGLNFRS